jgi:hypothetical protein
VSAVPFLSIRVPCTDVPAGLDDDSVPVDDDESLAVPDDDDEPVSEVDNNEDEDDDGCCAPAAGPNSWIAAISPARIAATSSRRFVEPSFPPTTGGL